MHVQENTGAVTEKHLTVLKMDAVRVLFLFCSALSSERHAFFLSYSHRTQTARLRWSSHALLAFSRREMRVLMSSKSNPVEVCTQLTFAASSAKTPY